MTDSKTGLDELCVVDNQVVAASVDVDLVAEASQALESSRT